MILRQDQLRALGARRQQNFEDRLLTHVRKYFPEQTRDLEDPSLRGLLRQGLERAKGHGFRTEQDLCKYVNLIFVFGLDFDAATDSPWARRILDNREIGPTLKINRLYLEGLKHEKAGREMPQSTTESEP